MTISSAMTALMDNARSLYHIDDKMTIFQLTDLLGSPSINNPLVVIKPNWEHVSGWGIGGLALVPVIPGVPIYVTAEIKSIGSTQADQGPEIMYYYADKQGQLLSPWTFEKNGDYSLADNDGLNGESSSFTNKSGVRTSIPMAITKERLRNVKYFSIALGTNVNTSFDYRRMIVSYYKPYTFSELLGGGS